MGVGFGQGSVPLRAGTHLKVPSRAAPSPAVPALATQQATQSNDTVMTKRTRPWRMSNLACVELLALKIYSLGRIPCGFSPTGCNFALLPKWGGAARPAVPPTQAYREAHARSVGRGPQDTSLKRNSRGEAILGGSKSRLFKPLADVPAQAPRRTRMRTRAGPRLARPRPRPLRSSAVAGGGGGAWRAGARGRCRLKRAGRRKAGCAIMAGSWRGTRAHLRGKLLGRSLGRLVG
jgi:hypothetical protein